MVPWWSSRWCGALVRRDGSGGAVMCSGAMQLLEWWRSGLKVAMRVWFRRRTMKVCWVAVKRMGFSVGLRMVEEGALCIFPFSFLVAEPIAMFAFLGHG